MNQLITRAAVVVLLVGGVGLLAVVARSNSEPAPVSNADETTPLTPQSLTPRLVAPAELPEGFEPVLFEVDARSSFEGAGIERIYSTVGNRIEDGPTLSVMAIDARSSEPQADIGAVDVTVQNSTGLVWSPDPTQQRLRFGPIDSTWYLLTGHGLDRTTLLALAETVTPDPGGFGAVVDLSQVPTDMEESASGARYGTTFVAREALEQPISTATWASDSGTFEYFVSVNGESAIEAGRLSAGRDVYDTIREIEINGAQGIVASGANLGGNYTTLYWSTGQETVSLTSRQLSEDDTIALAESMRPTSTDEWPR